MKLKTTPALALLAGLAAASHAYAAGADSFSDALANGDPSLDFRYRLELVDQDGKAKNATASTLLTKLGYATKPFNGFSGYLEFTNVAVIGKATYDDTVNGKTQYPIVADPASTEVNQAYLAYKTGGLTLKAGRQGINLGNQRFVGTVAWRQNDQTFDSVTAVYTQGKFMGAAGYVWNVNRINSDRNPLGDLHTDTEVLQLGYKAAPFLEVTGLALLIDLHNPAVRNLSSQTYGIRAAGTADIAGGVKFGYSAEYAAQSDYGQSALNYSASYYAVEASLSGHGLKGSVGYEVMGSDHGAAFQTPLATLHKFDGWADKFLTTPGNGLKDLYAGLNFTPKGGILDGFAFDAVYHDFSADSGGADYGKEFDWQISKKLTKQVSALVKGAHYRTDGFATDTDKFWFMLSASF